MTDVSLVKLPSDECNWILPMISQHWFRWWLGAVRQQAITWVNVDPDLCRHIRPQWVKDTPCLAPMGKLWVVVVSILEKIITGFNCTRFIGLDTCQYKSIHWWSYFLRSCLLLSHTLLSFLPTRWLQSPPGLPLSPQPQHRDSQGEADTCHGARCYICIWRVRLEKAFELL